MKKFFKSTFLTVCLSFIGGCLLVAYVLPYLTPKVSSWGPTELAILISIVAIVAQVAPPFIEKYLQKQDKSYYAIKLDVSELEDGNVQFEATIRNNGLVTIHPRYTKLYIDQGIPGSSNISNYEFPFILEHKDMTPEGDCILCDRCKREGGANEFPIDTLKDKFKEKQSNGELEYRCFPMDHLSEKSIKYIRAHEQFQENIILNFKKPGVYRATLVVITHDADCQCATEQFYVKIPT